jgi:hypothetical protein
VRKVISVFFGLLFVCNSQFVSAASWAVLATPSVGRVFPASTRLADGKVLVVSGYDYNTFIETRSTELYDPVTNSWSSVGNTIGAKITPSLATLPNGDVLAVGQSTQPVAETYNLVTQQWSDANAPFVREIPTAVSLPLGNVLVSGGLGGPNAAASSWLYNSATFTWTTTRPLIFDRARHTATVLDDGSVLIVGGGNSWTLQTYDFSERFVGGGYIDAGPITAARSQHAAVKLQTGEVLVIGGRNYQSGAPIGLTELYTTAGWRQVASPSLRYRQFHTATLLLDGRVLLIGGTNTSDISTGQVEIYDPMSNQWTFGPTMNYPRSGHTTTLLDDGRVFVSGGSWSALLPAEAFIP